MQLARLHAVTLLVAPGFRDTLPVPTKAFACTHVHGCGLGGLGPARASNLSGSAPLAQAFCGVGLWPVGRRLAVECGPVQARPMIWTQALTGLKLCLGTCVIAVSPLET